MKRSTFTALACAAAAAAFAFGLHRNVPAAPAQAAKDASADAQEQIAKLEQQVKNLEGLVPDQAAVMSHVGYHFANLWVAIDQENWPLADFYLGETRNNVKWAVRAKPIRKDPGGNDLHLAPIAEAIDNTQFTQLKQAIDAKDKPRSEQVYQVTLSACYGCHKASGKPYLRLRVPAAPEAPVINFDPNAKTPE